MSNYIFWPSELLRKEISISDQVLCLVAIKLKETDYVVISIENFSSSSSKELLNSLTSPYSVIGVRDMNGDWDISLPGFTIVEFEIPKFKLMEFYSIEPISLILSEHEIENNKVFQKFPNIEKIMGYERYQCKNYQLNNTIDIINAYTANRYAFHNTYAQFGHFEDDAMSIIGIIRKWYTSTAIYRGLCFVLYMITMIVCSLSYSGYIFIRNGIPKILSLSSTAKQIDLRLQQICYFPIQFIKINQSKALEETIPNYQEQRSNSNSVRAKEAPYKYYPDYIRFYNTLWLIVNDISFGLMLGAVLKDNHDLIINSLSEVVTTTLYDKMINLTYVLANNPFGIKLNHELASFLSELFYWIIEFSYNSLIKFTSDKEKLSVFLKIVTKISCVLGASFAISLVIDFFSLLFFHLYLFYHISRKLYHWQLNTLISLFYLFCGKKRNVLRKRIDYDYFELDELLLGTLLFIILTFLMPTVLSFYASFAVIWVSTVYIHVILNSIVSLINHFPLFAFLLRIKDPKRLPGGIILSPKHHKNGRIILSLENSPLKVNNMFKPFSYSMNKMKEYYFSMKTFKSLLGGSPIMIQMNEMYDVLYLWLPEEPMSIQETMTQLKECLPRKTEKLE
ncbi:phosphatidylinositol N-acetylglucosaminyltransferase subunit gpi1 [Maudiozyma exigua]|uniref:Phosphatidylinositol N-acetylglucosaminyltransferase subunit gpi1 n=1 Tax=Maudiozyma exigua TaxID=34358 RepID=A0A9P6VWG5_MAUEX|nr:phosphatidylinositol N-acetylglucosaminyltransferase subunit gpi1 [Kazachstania exigua]